jgi:hypothetical protein
MSPKIVLYAVVYGREPPVLSDSVNQSAAPEHMSYRILNLGEHYFGFRFFSLSDQPQQRIGR